MVARRRSASERGAMFAKMKGGSTKSAVTPNITKPQPAVFKKHLLKDLEKRKTLAVGQTDDLKIDTGTTRVWVARTTIEDGEPFNNRISVEKFNRKTGRWEIVDEYEGGKR